MEKISIKSKLYDYDVFFSNEISQILSDVENTTFVIDKNVYMLYSELFSKIDAESIFFVESVEQNKNMSTVMELMHFWGKIGIKKNWRVFCFGGGITQDVTTVASNLYLRNIDWYFFPTTLLSMCDSCIGGKCGINFGDFKNQIGVFYPPRKIFISTNFINTLNSQDYLNGWGEILKFSLTLSNGFYEDIKSLKEFIPCESIEYFIRKGLLVKKEIIEEDEFDNDLRRVLNYGHTFGHALESYTNYEIPHGEGVIWGIDVVNYISYKQGLISEDCYLDIKALIKKAFIKSEIVIDSPSELFDIIRSDKKVKNDTMYFAMLNKGRGLIVCPMLIDMKLQELFYVYLEDTHAYYCD